MRICSILLNVEISTTVQGDPHDPKLEKKSLYDILVRQEYKYFPLVCYRKAQFMLWAVEKLNILLVEPRLNRFLWNSILRKK